MVTPLRFLAAMLRFSCHFCKFWSSFRAWGLIRSFMGAKRLCMATVPPFWGVILTFLAAGGAGERAGAVRSGVEIDARGWV
eukprot:3729809-Rhodomonas_salina.1